MDEQLPPTCQSFSFEADSEAVEELLTETLADPEYLYRGPTSEVREGSIKFDESLRPVVETDIPSHAFRFQEWDGVIKSIRGALAATENQNLGSLISMSDIGEMQSPFIWTSRNANVGSSFSGSGDVKRVLMIMKPSPERVVVDSPSPGDFRKFIETIKARKPYLIKHGLGEVQDEADELIQESLPPGFGDWNETLLGPYIGTSEIRALISYDNKHSGQLEKLIYSINNRSKNLPT